MTTTSATTRLATSVGSLCLANPVLGASGTFGYGTEFTPFYDLSRIGGLVTKSVTPRPTRGNPPPRVAETPSGMLNAIGLQNDGVEAFLAERLPALREAVGPPPADRPPPRVAVNVAGHAADDYAAVVERLDGAAGVDAFEINVSCPNVATGGIAFGVCAQSCETLVRDLRRRTDTPLWVKLSPNVTDVAEVARAAEAAGADALVVANTLLGLAVDVDRRRPVLANVTGGLSGPAIRPVALRLVRQVAQATDLPVVGCGGIATAEDAVAFLLCGASAVEVGTMNFVEPGAAARIAADLDARLAERGETVRELVGALRTDPQPTGEEGDDV